MASLFQGLLKTPEQVRQEEQKALQERGLTAAAMLTQGGGGTTGLPGLLKGFGANIAQNIDTQAANLKQRGLLGLGSIAGAMGNQEAQSALSQASMSPAERQAVRQQGITANLDTTNIESLNRGIARLREAGADPQLIARLEERKVALQDKALTRERQARMDQQSSQEAAQKRRLVNLQIQQIEEGVTTKAEQKEAITSMLPAIDSRYMSTEMKNVVETLDPATALGFVKDAQQRERAAVKLAAFNRREDAMFSTIESKAGKTITSLPVSDINATYNKLIREAKAAGLTDKATQLENERKAAVSNKNDIQGIEEDLRKGFRKDSTIAAQREVIDQARKGITFLQTGEGATDVAGIITFMKSLDPGSVVREGEFNTAASLGGIIDSLGVTFKGYTEGDKLSQNQRDQLANAMAIAAQVAAESYNNFRQTEFDSYSNRGYDAQYIVGEPIAAPAFDKIVPDSTGVDDETAGALFGSFGDVN